MSGSRETDEEEQAKFLNGCFGSKVMPSLRQDSVICGLLYFFVINLYFPKILLK